jgi:hypothetical protein
MRTSQIITVCLLALVALSGHAQSIVGTWQLVKQTTCLEDQVPQDTSASTQDLLADMKSRNDRTPQTIRFTDNLNGEEDTKILNTRKNVNTKHFMYKVDGNTLYILDKKSHTISETYNIDSWQGDNLILSNASRPCETRVLVRVK